MELSTLAIVIVVVFVGAVFQASIGFGANVIAQPIVLLLEPSLVPGSVLLANAALSWLVMARERESIDRQALGSAGGGAIVGLLTGTAIGVVVVRAASADGLAIIVALSVLTMIALLAGDRIRVDPSPRSISLAAVAGGFAGTTAGIGGPPMALVYRDAKGPTVRSSLAGFFVISSPVALAGLAIAGRFGWTELGAGIALLPVTTAGFLASKPLLPLVDRGITRPAILGVSAAAALLLLVRTLAG